MEKGVLPVNGLDGIIGSVRLVTERSRVRNSVGAISDLFIN